MVHKRAFYLSVRTYFYNPQEAVVIDWVFSCPMYDQVVIFQISLKKKRQISEKKKKKFLRGFHISYLVGVDFQKSFFYMTCAEFHLSYFLHLFRSLFKYSLISFSFFRETVFLFESEVELIHRLQVGSMREAYIFWAHLGRFEPVIRILPRRKKLILTMRGSVCFDFDLPVAVWVFTPQLHIEK
jgi:hypothetical protein